MIMTSHNLLLCGTCVFFRLITSCSSSSSSFFS
jgi:hypothetical protein